MASLQPHRVRLSSAVTNNRFARGYRRRRRRHSRSRHHRHRRVMEAPVIRQLLLLLCRFRAPARAFPSRSLAVILFIAVQPTNKFLSHLLAHFILLRIIRPFPYSLSVFIPARTKHF